MIAQNLDVVVRVATGAELLLLAALLLRDAPRARLSWLFLPLAICFCGFLNGNTPAPDLRIGGSVGWVAHLLSGYAAVFLWWFCLGLFDRSFRLTAVPLAVGTAWIATASIDRAVFGPALADKGLSWLLVVMALGIVGHIAWRLIRDLEGDLVEARRNARVLVAIFLAAQLLADIGVDLAFGFAWRPRGFTLAQNGAILISGLWLGALFLRASVADDRYAPATADLPSQASYTQSPDPEAKLVERLRGLMEVDRVHLDPNLTFNNFAGRMAAPERTVRDLINRRLGHDHFRAFLNGHRVAEACRRLRDPGHAGEKLLAIAFDSGFNSLASFNRAFRADQGCTPSEYRAAAAAKAPVVPAKPRDSAFEEPIAG